MTKRAILLITYLFVSFAIAGQSTDSVIVINKTDQLLNIGMQVYLLEDQEGKLTIDDIQKPEYQKLFKKSDKEIPYINTTQSKIWVKFTVINHTREKVYLEVAQATAWYVDFYRPDTSNRLILQTQTGNMRPLKSREISNNFFLFELPEEAEPQTCYFSIQSEFAFTIPLLIGSLKTIFEYRYPYILFFGCLRAYFL